VRVRSVSVVCLVQLTDVRFPRSHSLEPRSPLSKRKPRRVGVRSASAERHRHPLGSREESVLVRSAYLYGSRYRFARTFLCSA